MVLICLRRWGLGVALVFAGCGDSDDGAKVVDAGSSGGPGAADAGDRGDAAGTGDAGTVKGFGSVPDPGDTVLTLVGPGGPLAGVLVSFHDAGGNVTVVGTTNASGQAFASSGAMISAFLTEETSHRIVTWVGVEQGAKISFSTTRSLGAHSVTLSPFSGATSYGAFTGHCGAEATSTDLSFAVDSSCQGTPNSLLAVAYKSADPIAFAFAKSLAAPPQKVTPGAWSAPGSVTVSTSAEATPARVQLAQVVGGLAYESPLTAIGGSGTSFPVATGFADGLQANHFVQGSTSGAWRASGHRAAPAATLAATMPGLPELGAITLSGGGGQPTISWATTPKAATGGIVRLTYTGARTAEGYQWTLVVPPTAASVTVPAVPAEGASYVPISLDGIAAPEVGFIQASTLASYQSFVAVPTVTDWFPGTFHVPALPADGDVNVTAVSRAGSLE